MKSRQEKKNSLKLLWYKIHFLCPQFQLMSEILKSWRKIILFFKRNGVFLSFFFFFFSRNNQTQEILYSIFISKSWGPTCCSCGCDSFDEWEKRLGYSSFKSSSDGHSCSGLGFPLTSYNKSQNNTSTFQLSGLARVFEYTVYRGFLNRVYGILQLKYGYWVYHFLWISGIKYTWV